MLPSPSSHIAMPLIPVEVRCSRLRKRQLYASRTGLSSKALLLSRELAKLEQGQVVRLYLDCVHYKKAMKNSRKLNEVG